MMPLNYQINLYESIILQDSMTKLKHILRLFVPPIYYEAKHALFPQKKEERFPLLQIEHTCNRMIIIGNGPSLNKTVELYEQQLHEADCVMVNFSASTSLFERIRPKYYLLADPGFLHSEANREAMNALLNALKEKTAWPMTIILPDFLRAWKESAILQENENITMLSYNNSSQKINDDELFQALDENRVGPPAQTVLNAAVWLSIYWGYQETYIVGADMSYLKDVYVGQKNNVVYTIDRHFYNNNEVCPEEIEPEKGGHKLGMTMEQLLDAVHIMFQSYRQLSGYAKWKGVKLYNASEYSMIDCIERKKLK